MVEEGYIRCNAHIVNLAVQTTLRSLKATLAEDFDVYRLEDNCDRITSEQPKQQVTSSLEKV